MHAARRVALCAALPLLFCGITPSAHGQFDEPPPPAAYALRNVTLVRADGSRETGLTIVVRGTSIERIGQDSTVPLDAEVLEGDSLVVYPGIVDAAGGADLDMPESEIEREDLEPWAPPRSAQGFTPHRRAVDFLAASGPDLDTDRQRGIVAGAVHPGGPVMPGRGAVLLYRPSAQTPTELVLRPELGPTASLRGARGTYPATVFAVMAFMRQSFENARHDGAVRTAHARDPRGMTPPHWDPDYEILRAVLSGEVPVYFAADESEDIRMVLRLAAEYGFRPIIVGGAEAWRVADLLRERDVPVLVSVDFPKPERWKPAGDTVESPVGIEPAVEREKRKMEDLYANAGRLAEAGVRFALTSGGGEADIREGGRLAIAHGLSEELALAAVTSVPAELLGVAYISRVEAEMPATFTVATGPLFNEDTEIAYTFVAGEVERGKARTEPSGGEAPSVDMTGTWTIEIDTGDEILEGRMTLTQDGADFSGSIALDIGQVEVRSGTVTGNAVSFTLVVDMGGEVVEADAKGTVKDEEASGSGGGPMGDFSWTATRTETPGRGSA